MRMHFAAAGELDVVILNFVSRSRSYRIINPSKQNEISRLLRHHADLRLLDSCAASEPRTWSARDVYRLEALRVLDIPSDRPLAIPCRLDKFAEVEIPFRLPCLVHRRLDWLLFLLDVEERSCPLGLPSDFAFIAAILALRRSGGGLALAVPNIGFRRGFRRDFRAAVERGLPSSLPVLNNVPSSFKLDDSGLLERLCCSRTRDFILVELGLTFLPTFDERNPRRIRPAGSSGACLPLKTSAKQPVGFLFVDLVDSTTEPSALSGAKGKSSPL